MATPIPPHPTLLARDLKTQNRKLPQNSPPQAHLREKSASTPGRSIRRMLWARSVHFKP